MVFAVFRTVVQGLSEGYRSDMTTENDALNDKNTVLYIMIKEKYRNGNKIYLS